MKVMKLLSSLVPAALLICSTASAGGMSNDQILEELRELRRNQEALNVRIKRLEKELDRKKKQVEALKAQTPEAKKKPEGPRWYDRIEFSGAVEAEFGNTHEDFKDNTDPDLPRDKVQEHDVTLATVELGVDARVNRYVRGHVLLLYEEDEDGDRVRLDEGTIYVGGTPETRGFYAMAGKYYPRFGELNSFLVSDPLTLEIFETRESAVEAGWEHDWISVGAGIFNGDVQEDFHRENNRVNGFFADVNMHNPEGTLGGLSLLAGASYLSSVADSDTLEGEVVDRNGDTDVNDIEDYVGGIAAYVVAEYGPLSLGAEYITALDDFRAGEMAYAVNRTGEAVDTRPRAWNLECAYRPVDVVQVSARYEGSDEMYDLFPEDQYGLAVSWEVFKYTTLSVEYLHGEYEDNAATVDRDRDVFTGQCAIEF